MIPDQPFPLNTMGGDGQRTFMVVPSPSQPRDGYLLYEWRVDTNPRRAEGSVLFQFEFGQYPDGELILLGMFHNDDPQLRRRGIARAMIAEVSWLFSRGISSTTVRGRQRAGEIYRNLDADLVWNDLVNRNRATYNPDTDRFTFTL